MVAAVALVALTVIVFTGAAVRVTGSGLGCPHWPECYSNGRLVAELNSHAWIEFGNRMFTGFVALAAIAAGLLAFFRVPFRRDLAVLGVLLPLGRRRPGRDGRADRPLRPRARLGHGPLPALDDDPRRRRGTGVAGASGLRRRRGAGRRPRDRAGRVGAVRARRRDHLRRHGGDGRRPARGRRGDRRRRAPLHLQGIVDGELAHRPPRRARRAARRARRRHVVAGAPARGRSRAADAADAHLPAAGRTGRRRHRCSSSSTCPPRWCGCTSRSPRSRGWGSCWPRCRWARRRARPRTATSARWPG